MKKLRLKRFKFWAIRQFHVAPPIYPFVNVWSKKGRPLVEVWLRYVRRDIAGRRKINEQFQDDGWLWAGPNKIIW